MSKKKTPGAKPMQKTEDESQENQETENDGDGEDGDSDDSEDQNKRINAIVTSRVKREMKGVLAQLSTLTDAISKLSSPPKKTEEEDDEDSDAEEASTKQAEAKTDPKVMKKMTKLERELAEERDARKKAEQREKEQHERAQRQEMLGAFDSALQEAGVTDNTLRSAALGFLEQRGTMVRDEETGKIKFKGVDKYGIDTLYDPKAGIKNWVVTEGRSFIPAVEAGGSGTGAARQGVGNTGLSKSEHAKLTPAQKAAIELERACAGLPKLD